MRILVTNDDGINAPGLKKLIDIAQELAGHKGEVWSVAPTTERSGNAHLISLATPMMITEVENRRFALEGSPADCVIAGIHFVMKNSKPDLILSGINRGNNSAENALYSGTLGAAMEGALQGITSIALSQYLGTKNFNLENPFDAAENWGAQVIKKILKNISKSYADYKLFFNVNFPPCPSNLVKGIKVLPQGRRKKVCFDVVAAKSPRQKQFLFINGSNQQKPSQKNTDAAANLDDFVTVTPMTGDLTAHEEINVLKVIE